MESNKKNFKLCDICKIEAKNLCLKCYRYYCEECFNYVHNKKENISHKKEKIDYFVPMDLQCPEHNGNRMNLFCIDEKGNFIILYFYFLI